jgi:Rrf2 family protein
MLSKTARHALAAILSLADLPDGDYAGAADIAAQIGAPRNYLGKLLKLLADEGLLESQKGKGGGFRLARPSEEISVFEVVEPIDRVSRWNGCFMGQGRCSDDAPCTMHHRWAGVRNAYLRFLQETSIASVARGAETIGTVLSPEIITRNAL